MDPLTIPPATLAAALPEYQFDGARPDVFEQAFHDRVQTPCSDVLGGLINSPGDFRDFGQTVFCESQMNAIDAQQLPRELLDPKISNAYRVLALSKRGNRLTVATADPTQQEAAEQIKFTTQLLVDWVESL